MPSRHDLTLEWDDGRSATVSAREDETVLDAAAADEVALPFGCRTGACGSCTGRLLAGAVTYERSPRALRTRHVEAGYVLLCIACARTDCRIAVGADRLTELGSVERPHDI